MEEVISILGLVVGVAGLASALVNRIRISVKNKSIGVKFGHKKDDPKVRISDISRLTVGEIDSIRAELSDLNFENGETRRHE
jgi:hypothetical protein